MPPDTMKQPKNTSVPPDPDLTIEVATQVHAETLQVIGRTINPGRCPPVLDMPAADALVEGFLAALANHDIKLSDEERSHLVQEAEKLQVEYGIRDFIGNLITFQEPSRRVRSSTRPNLLQGA